MKRSFLLATMLAALVGCATAVSDADFSLRKGTVFEPLTPATFDFDSGTAGKALIEPVAGSGMPPMISHPIADYVPITATSNTCLAATIARATGARRGQRGKGRPRLRATMPREPVASPHWPVPSTTAWRATRRRRE